MAFFSVIIPVYNAAEWLEECLYSVVHQREQDFEIVVVNDGSTDGSVEILDEYIKAWPQLKWKLISQENRGLGAARNAGMAAAEGEYLAFLDADDYWSLNKLSYFKMLLAENRSDWLYHQVFELYPDGYLHRRRGFAVDSLHDLLVKGNPISPSATLIKKDVLQKFSGFNEDRRGHGVEDLDLWIRLFDGGYKPIYVSSYFTVYRIGSGMTASLSGHFEHIRFVMDRACEKGWVNDAQRDEFNRRKNYEKARQLHKNGAYKEAIEAYSTQTGLKSALLKFLAGTSFRI